MSELLAKVRYDVTIKGGHSDHRRTIYDAEKITGDLDGEWFPHGIMSINFGLELGKHFHDYDEMFFTPNGTFTFKLVNIDNLETRKYLLHPGSRLLIPKEIGHISVCDVPQGVLMGYGNVPYDSKRTFPCSERALEALAQIK